MNSSSGFKLFTMNTVKKILLWFFFSIGILASICIIFLSYLASQGKAEFNPGDRIVNLDSINKDLPDVFSMGEVPALLAADTFITMRRIKDKQLKEIPKRIGMPVYYYLHASYCVGCIKHYPELKSLKEKYKGKLLIVPVSAEPILNFSTNIRNLNRNHFLTYFFMVENYNGQDGKEFLNEYVNKLDLTAPIEVIGYPVSLIVFPDARKSEAFNKHLSDEELAKYVQ